MRYGALSVRPFGLQALARVEPPPGDGPVVLLEGEGKHSRIREVDTRAYRNGVRPGQSVARALGRVPGLVLRTASPSAEKLAGDLLTEVLLEVSPVVEESGPGLRLFDLRGLNGFRPTVDGGFLLERLSARGLRARLSFGGTPGLALLGLGKARPLHARESREELLRDLPLAHAPVSPEAREVLRQWGLSDLRAVADLDRTDLGARLGGEGRELWDLLHGREERVLNPRRPAPVFRAAIELESPVESLPPALFVLRRLLDDLASRFERAGRVAEGLRLVLLLDAGGAGERERVYDFQVPSPTADPAALFRILEARLEQVRTGAPLIGLSVEARDAAPVVDQSDLFRSAFRDPRSFFATVSRLEGLFGTGRVGLPRLQDSHRPDDFRLERVSTPEVVPAAHPVGPLAGPPLRRFRPPRPVRVRWREGRPWALAGDGVEGPLAAARGPWRISGNWWDANPWSREEWDVQLVDGGLFRLVREGRACRLEGVYD